MRIPGLVSAVFLSIALIVADIALFTHSVPLGLVYAVFIPLSLLPALALYCRKCPHAADGTCRHVILGPVARALFGSVPPAPYTVPETLGALVPLAAVLAFPQYWLFQAAGFAFAFWVPTAVAGAMIPIGVCPGCGNLNCKLRPVRKK